MYCRMRQRCLLLLLETKRSGVEKCCCLVVYCSSSHRLLQKCSLVHSSKSMERDSKRQEASQLALKVAQNRADLEAQRETLAKLTHEVSSLEHQLNQVGLAGICVCVLYSLSFIHALPVEEEI